MNLAIGIVIGLIAGWLIEWFIDWRFWRRGGRRETLAQSAGPDNLTRIEGIGPKLQAILNAAGIATFESLANKKPQDLTAIIEAAGFKAPFDPSSWPEQAELAAKDDWEALLVLQDRLLAGREADS